MKYIILQASARSEGNTHKIVQALQKHIVCDVLDLKTKKIASLSCGSDAEEVVGFHAPFELSAAYLDMEYIGAVHTWIAEKQIAPEVLERIEYFAKKIKTALE